MGKVACFKLGKKEKPRVIMPGTKLTIAMLKFNGTQKHAESYARQQPDDANHGETMLQSRFINVNRCPMRRNELIWRTCERD